MRLHNSTTAYGLVSISLHWISAVMVIALFGLGLWMVELTYYDEWYTRAPKIHKGAGVILILLTLMRLLWKWLNPSPLPMSEHTPLERRLAKYAHVLLYLLLLMLGLSGYFISTADGRALEVFNWFSIPATLSGIEHQEDIAGDIHEVLAYTLIALVIVHMAGAIKHHVLDKDNTLRRMLGV